MNRQQLERRHAEALEVADDRVGGQSQIGAPQTLGHIRMLNGHPFDVALVNDGAVPGNPGRPVVFPAERRLDHDRLRHAAGTVLRIQ
jgi:hypothetical protein